MRLEEFREELHAVGWEATGDAQHNFIESLRIKLFPAAAEME